MYGTSYDFHLKNDQMFCKIKKIYIYIVSIQIPLPAPALECPLVSGWVFVEQPEEGVIYWRPCRTDIVVARLVCLFALVLHW